ncbi:MAG: hypothetical protein QOD56_15 [Gammaproteobacteria bacterium]|jgi:hypothetical protein|nr:hypothetical protein [Gammaproteobacteria bacterium]
MHILYLLVVILSPIVLLVAGLLSVLHGLLGRSPHAPPIVSDDGLNQQPLGPGTPAPRTYPAAESRYGNPTRWDTERAQRP